jgi:heme/copper-type cytochrome/quinol oxidase subunit 2
MLCAAAVVLVAGEAAAQGCAMCKTALGGPGDPLSNGINASIFFMMSMPFVLFAVVGGWLTYMFRKHRPETGASEGVVQRPELKLLHAEREGAR